MSFAFVFPGQGSQSVGMLDAWLGHAEIEQLLVRANTALESDLVSLIADGPIELLNLTTNTQPAMLVAGLAAYTAWVSAGGPVPTLMAGHSLGEYTALTASGCLQFEDAVRLVRIRADAMQAAVPVGTGAMAAILGLSDEAVKVACDVAAQGQIVEAVNFNAPNQVVIAGHEAAVERAMVAAKVAGAKRAIRLPVSAPFHSSLIKPAANVLSQALAQVKIDAPNVSVIHNVDVLTHQSSDEIQAALVSQAWHAVQWVRTIQAMRDAGITHIVECGPGKVLAGLVKRIDPELIGLSVTDPESLQLALDTVTI